VTNGKAFNIWGRIVGFSWDDLTAEQARAILKLKLTKADRKRVEHLSSRAASGKLSNREREELDDYLYSGRVLALMHSLARRALKGTKPVAEARRKAS